MNTEALQGKHTMGIVQVKPIKYIGHLNNVRERSVDANASMLTYHSPRDFPIVK